MPKGYGTFNAEVAKVFSVKDRSIAPLKAPMGNVPQVRADSGPPQVEPSELEEYITGGDDEDDEDDYGEDD